MPSDKIRSGDFLLRSTFSKVVRIAFGLIFIFASIDKIADPQSFKNIIISYDIIPIFFAPILAIILPWVELIAGIFLVVGIKIRHTSFFLSALLLTFIIATVISFFNGTFKDCGCFPRWSPLSTSNIYLIILRDMFFLFLGTFTIVAYKSEH